MDDLEITVFDEIKDYKEKIYFFNIRQWIFAILIAVTVVPTYLILKNKIGEEITSYIVIIIAAILGFVGFVKIHELPAERIIPYWIRHYLFFAKPIHYVTDEEYRLQHEKHRKKVNKTNNLKKRAIEVAKMKKKKHTEKTPKKIIKKERQNTKDKDNLKESELSKKLSKLSKEQQEALLKLLER